MTVVGFFKRVAAPCLGDAKSLIMQGSITDAEYVLTKRLNAFLEISTATGEDKKKLLQDISGELSRLADERVGIDAFHVVLQDALKAAKTGKFAG